MEKLKEHIEKKIHLDEKQEEENSYFTRQIHFQIVSDHSDIKNHKFAVDMKYGGGASTRRSSIAQSLDKSG